MMATSERRIAGDELSKHFDEVLSEVHTHVLTACAWTVEPGFLEVADEIVS